LKALALTLLGLALTAAPAFAIENPPPYSNPVVAGDFPDPTVVRVGGEYWATVTGTPSNPNMPILRSSDLVHWTQAGSVFQERPEWSDGRLWAPEMFRDSDRYLIYYSAGTPGNRMCIRVAASSLPIGPYEDIRSIVCQPAGSIDASVLRNGRGTPYLFWKEDRNTEGIPAVIWGQALSPDRTHLIGQRRKVLAATREWEANLIEAPFVFRRRGYVYMLYSGNLCCGPKCEYAMGIARSKGLFGPWKRWKRNPIVDSNDEWLCPGHGTAIQSPDGRWWLMYHAYDADLLDGRRHLLLDAIRWTRDGWPVVNRGRGPSGAGSPPT
jgi:beta-xylosidase